jgi:4-amino-4-deoxy-L-arabinose transferase-like glycosyltransferase
LLEAAGDRCRFGACLVAGTFAERLAPASLKERWPVRGVIAAAVLFNPAVIALSAGWGQVDSVPVFIVLSSLLLLFTGSPSLRRELAAFALLSIAFAMKPQTCLVLPVMAYALYRRYLHGRPRPELIDGALSIALCAALAVGILLLSGVRSGRCRGSRRHYRCRARRTGDQRQRLQLLGSRRILAERRTGNAVRRLAGIPVVYIGVVAFLVATVYALARARGARARPGGGTRPPRRSCAESARLRLSRGCTSGICS